MSRAGTPQAGGSGGRPAKRPGDIRKAVFQNLGIPWRQRGLLAESPWLGLVVRLELDRRPHQPQEQQPPHLRA
jgi:hypothetical protein